MHHNHKLSGNLMGRHKYTIEQRKLGRRRRDFIRQLISAPRKNVGKLSSIDCVIYRKNYRQLSFSLSRWRKFLWPLGSHNIIN